MLTPTEFLCLGGGLALCIILYCVMTYVIFP